MSNGSDRTPEQMFRVGYVENIEAVEVVKRTPHFVVYIDRSWPGKIVQRRERGDRFFSTWDEAKQSIVDDYEAKIRWKREEIHRLESRLGQIRKMKP